MEPANPPFPALRNFPFQSETGSQTSKRMYESLVGRITPATRQNAGRLLRVLPKGGTNFPAGAERATVRVVSGSLVFSRVAQSAARAGVAPIVGIRNIVTMMAHAANVCMVLVGSLKFEVLGWVIRNCRIQFRAWAEIISLAILRQLQMCQVPRSPAGSTGRCNTI